MRELARLPLNAVAFAAKYGPWAVIAGASTSKDIQLRRKIMATTQQTGIGFRLTDDVLESDHVQHLTFGPGQGTADGSVYAR